MLRNLVTLCRNIQILTSRKVIDMVGFGDTVRMRGIQTVMLVVDIVSPRVVITAWRDRTDSVHELIVSKSVLEKVDGQLHKRR